MNWHQFLSAVLPLLTLSPNYRKETFEYIVDKSLYPAYQSGQYALEQGNDNNAYAFVSWAIITPDILEDIRETLRPLETDEWQSGKGKDDAILFCNDFVAPFGNCLTMKKYLDKELFADCNMDAYSRHSKWTEDGELIRRHLAQWRRKDVGRS